MRAYKTVNDSYIEPISFIVPRRAEVFQSDIYPPATGLKAGMSAADWASGKSALPPKIDLESVYEGNAPTEVASDYKPSTPAPAAPPAKAAPAKKEPEPEPTPAPAASRGVIPKMTEQIGSGVAALASKFKDNDPESDDDADETSSFEEVSRPVQRSAPAASKPEPKPAAPVKAAAPVASSPIKSPVTQTTPRFSPSSTTPATQTSSAPVSGGGSASAASSTGSVETSLAQIKALLEAQTQTLNAQSRQIGTLAAEVDTLKMKVGGGSQEQSERIRQLELELEEARS